MRIQAATAAVAVFVLAFVAPMAGPATSRADQARMEGWELGSPYNNLYKASELDRIKVTVVQVTEVTPMEGMSPAAALKVREADDDEEILVHLCPTWFMSPGQIGLKKGDVVKIRGCWAEIEGRDVFMASKIKMGDFFSLKVRLTKDGTPFWLLSPEELARERASD